MGVISTLEGGLSRIIYVASVHALGNGVLAFRSCSGMGLCFTGLITFIFTVRISGELIHYSTVRRDSD